MKDNILDLVKTVVSTGFFDKIKVNATTTSVTIEAMEKEKEVIFKANFLAPIEGLVGEFGLSNLSLLGHISKDPEFNMKESTLTVVYEDKNGEKIPAELAYVNKSKSNISYRFMAKQLVPDQPKFAEPVWDVVIKPTKSNIQQFAWAAEGLSSYEAYCTPKIQNGNLKFFIGEEDAANQRGGVVFAEGLTEKFVSDHKWKISHLQTILQLANSAELEMAFSAKGAIQVTVNTGVGNYRFIFPAKVR